MLLQETDVKKLSTIKATTYGGKRIQYRRDANTEKLEMIGFDTETYHGFVFLIRDSDGRELFNPSPEELIKFLTYYKYENKWNFFYGLSYDAGAIMKTVFGEKLNVYKNTRKLEFKHGEYTFSYIPKKQLTIQKGKHHVIFGDIAQFYNTSLERAYEATIGELPAEYKDFKMKLKDGEFSKRFIKNNRKRISWYCGQDCKFTMALAEAFINPFGEAFGFYPKHILSAGYLAEKAIINNNISIPYFDSLPYPQQEFIYASSFAGRFELIKRGHIGEAYFYDINSAYPAAMCHIPDFNSGEWVQGNVIEEKAKAGYYKIKVNLPLSKSSNDETHIALFPFRTKWKNIYPVGEFVTYATLAELKVCPNPEWYDIIDSYQFIPSTNYYPLKDFVERLYKERQEFKKNNDPREKPIKTVMNSIYGKTGAFVKQNKKMGNLFFPPIFSFITGECRAQVYDFIMTNNLQSHIVAIATDSICITKKLGIPETKEMGKFSLQNYGDDVCFFQNGIYRVNGKWKTRGMGTFKGKRMEHVDTKEIDGRLFMLYEYRKNIQLIEGIIHDKIDEIARIKPVTKKVNLNADRGRLWVGRIDSLNSKTCNESTPFSLSHIRKEKI